MFQFEVGKETLMELLTLKAAPGQPGVEVYFPKTKDFCDGREFHLDHEQVQDSGNGGGQGFQAIQDGVMADGELLAAELAAQVLDALIFSMCAIFDERVEGLSLNQKAIAAWIDAEQAMGANGLFLPPNPFAQASGEDVFCANDCRIVSSSCFCSAVRAILNCF